MVVVEMVVVVARIGGGGGKVGDVRRIGGVVIRGGGRMGGVSDITGNCIPDVEELLKLVSLGVIFERVWLIIDGV